MPLQREILQQAGESYASVNTSKESCAAHPVRRMCKLKLAGKAASVEQSTRVIFRAVTMPADFQTAVV